MLDQVVLMPLQALDPSLVLDLPGLVRALVAFGGVLALGAVILWRYGDLVDRSIEASIDQPLTSLGYGVATHLTIVFFGVYTASQLGQLSVSGRSLAGIGLLAGIAVLAAVAALGFTVVGTAAVELRWGRRRWWGLLLGAVMAALVVLAEPLIAGLIWIVVVSTGIGGPVKSWFHAADDIKAAKSS